MRQLLKCRVVDETVCDLDSMVTTSGGSDETVCDIADETASEVRF
jgi:hypothetical protein